MNKLAFCGLVLVTIITVAAARWAAGRAEPGQGGPAVTELPQTLPVNSVREELCTEITNRRLDLLGTTWASLRERAERENEPIRHIMLENADRLYSKQVEETMANYEKCISGDLPISSPR